MQKTLIRKKGIIYKLKKYRTLLLMVLPAMLFFFVFSYLPMGGLVLAFKEFKYNLGIFGSPWNGFDNFRFFFISGQAFNVTKNTILYNLSFLIVNNIFQIAVAIAVTEVAGKCFRKITQTMMFFPYFISWVVVGSFVYNIFNYEYGVLNSLLRSINMEPVDIYGIPDLWRLLMVLFSLWKSVGYGSIIYMAAIMNIDTEMYEAAEIDGANIFQRIRHITLPFLKTTAIMLCLLAIGHIIRGDFQMFYQLIGDTGTLFNATDVIDTFVFRSLLRTHEFGMAAASGFYQSVIGFFIIMACNYIVKRVNSDYALF